MEFTLTVDRQNSSSYRMQGCFFVALFVWIKYNK